MDVLRVSPQAEGTEAVIEAFAACLRGDRDPLEAARTLNAGVAVWRLRRLLAGQAGPRQVEGSDVRLKDLVLRRFEWQTFNRRSHPGSSPWVSLPRRSSASVPHHRAIDIRVCGRKVFRSR